MNTTKFKVGDKVRITSCFSSSCWYADKIGEVFTILGPSEFGYYVEEKLVGYAMYSVKECDIELVKEEWKEGIPQVGTICEAQVKNGGEWREYEISFVGDEYMVIKDHISETPIKYIYWEFRPIKTAEEIADEEEAKERGRVVEQMHEIYMEGCKHLGGLYALYDAGFRLVKADE